MIQRFKNWLKGWWKRHIVDVCPPQLEEYEFGDKWKNLK